MKITNRPYFLRVLLVWVILITLKAGVCFGQDSISSGLKFSSYEKSKDLRTGLNLTPEEPIQIKKQFILSFDFSFWRQNQSYGHIFRLISDDDLNIDLVSNPFSSSLNDLTLIVGDSTTAIDFSFPELGLDGEEWKNIKLIIDIEEDFIELNIGEHSKRDIFLKEINNLNISFGSSTFGMFSTSDVPPMIIRNINLFEQEKLIRFWPLSEHREIYSYDEINYHTALAHNPHWLIDEHSRWMVENQISTAERPQFVYDHNNTFYLLTSNQLISYDLNTHTSEVQPLKNSSGLPFSQSSIYNPKEHEIWVFDLDSLKVNKLSIKDSLWYETPSQFSVQTSHYHANKILDQNGDFLFFGGYGHYNYKNELLIYNDGKWVKKIMDGIDPRYLAAMGQNSKGELLIFGGYGSSSGSQEIRPHTYYQLYQVDKDLESPNQLWEIDNWEFDHVFSNSMYITSDDSSFYVLRYPKEKYKSKVVLDNYNVYSKKHITFADSLDFNFNDISSFADLVFNQDNQQLIAVLISEGQNGYITQFSSIKFPPLLISEIIQKPPKEQWGMKFVIIITVSMMVVIVLVFMVLRKRKSHSPTIRSTDQDQTDSTQQVISKKHPQAKIFKKSAILFMGGFQIIDKEGKDISEKFTTTLRTLLSLILLNSINEGKGVSSSMIWEILWSDKPENKARNNRNVNIKKLRGILSEVGDISVKNIGDKWKIELDQTIFFDYGYIQEVINKEEELSETTLRLAKKGNILPAMEFEWLDHFKSEFSNQLIDLLIRLSSSYAKNEAIQIEIADAIFHYDIISQDALIIKIHYLNSNGKFELAKKCYNLYSREYLALYDEEFDLHFDEIIHS